MSELELILRKAAALHDAGSYNDALLLYDDALNRWPDEAALWNNRGNSLLEKGSFEEAADSYRHALNLLPSLHDSRVALATALQAMGDINQAFLECKKVLESVPSHAEAHWNYSLLLLLQGDYEAGFREYEWRWKKRRFSSPLRKFDKPRWSGENPEGRTILVYAEQGFGDTIQFCRYLPLLEMMGAKIVFECHQPLIPIMYNVGKAIKLIPFGKELPDFDCHIPLISLPHIFGSRVETIPNNFPYLFVSNERTRFWKTVIPVCSGLRVGLCWAGKSYPDPRRSCDPELLMPLASLPDICWYSLQMGANVRKPSFNLTDLTILVKDFEDTAALIEQFDLVITIDTAVAHLAGALGKKTWLLTPFAPDWRWGLRDAGCPWYPSIRLFRQKKANDWKTVVQEVVAALSELSIK